MHDDHSPVFGIAPAHYQSGTHRTIDELHCAVVLQLQHLRQMADAGRGIRRHALDGQQQPVLLRVDSRAARIALGQAPEAADVIAELGERPVVPH